MSADDDDMHLVVLSCTLITPCGNHITESGVTL